MTLYPWEEHKTQMAADPRSSDELIRLALEVGEDEPTGRTAICVLLARGSEEVFIIARTLLDGGMTAERCLGALLLGQFGMYMYAEKDSPFFEERLALLHARLADEDDVEVLLEIISALYFLRDERSIPLLLACQAHASPDIRAAVARALAGYTAPEAIQALITLSRDADDTVRDWAVSSLADLEEAPGRCLDTDAIHDALLARLNDADAFTRSGALAGLAYRGDPRVIVPLLRELAQDDHLPMIDYALVAAGLHLGDPRLLPALVAYRAKQEQFYEVTKSYDSFYADEQQRLQSLQDIETAITRCRRHSRD